MARPKVADFVKETTLTMGTGDLSLAGAATGFQSFAEAFDDGDKVYYAMVDDPTSITQREIGIGTFTAGTPNTLSRDTVLDSSNAGALVNFTAGGTVIATATADFLMLLIDALDNDRSTAGTSTAYTLVTSRPGAGLYEGRFICAYFHTANGASPTLKTDSDAAKPIVDVNGAAPPAGSMPASYYMLKYHSGTWIVLTPFNYLSGSGGTVSGDLTVTGTIDAQANAKLTGEISPTSLSAQADDYSPTGLAAASVVRQACSANVDITGLAAGASGDIKVWTNISSTYSQTLKNASTSSTAVNRFSLGGDVTLGPLQSIILRYDGTLTRWAAASPAPVQITQASIQGGYKRLKIVTADDGTSSTVTAAQITLEDTNGRPFRAENVNVTVDASTSGAGGLDTGSIAAGKTYYKWVIAKPDGTVNAIESLANGVDTTPLNPTLPSGYTYKARVGALITKSGSAKFLGMLQRGPCAQYTEASSNLPLMASGTAAKWIAVSTTGYVPSTASAIALTALTFGGAVAVAPNNTYASVATAPIDAGVSGYQQNFFASFLLESSNIYWYSAQTQNNVRCLGWTDDI